MKTGASGRFCDLAPAYHLVRDAVQREIDAMAADETLVVLMGETHTMPAHRMIHAALLSYLADRRDRAPAGPARRFVVCHEMPYNFLDEAVRRIYRIDTPAAFHDRLHEDDGEGRGGLRAALPLVSRSQALLFRLCLKRRILSCFNDVAYRSNVWIHFSDPVASRLAQEKYGVYLALEGLSLTPEIDGDSRGFAVRNAAMAERALACARRHRARIIVQRCGANHIYGNEMKAMAYRDSLCAHFNRAGCRVIGVFFGFMQGRGRLEPGVGDANPRHMFLENYPLNGGNPPHAVMVEQEEMEGLIAAYSGDSCLFADTEDPPSREETRKILERRLGAPA